MAVAFRCVTSPPLVNFDAAAPNGVVIGIIGENGAGKSRLLRVAAGIEKPAAGSVEVSDRPRLLEPLNPLELP